MQLYANQPLLCNITRVGHMEERETLAALRGLACALASASAPESSQLLEENVFDLLSRVNSLSSNSKLQLGEDLIKALIISLDLFVCAFISLIPTHTHLHSLTHSFTHSDSFPHQAHLSPTYTFQRFFYFSISLFFPSPFFSLLAFLV